jgi:hypothetical protein
MQRVQSHLQLLQAVSHADLFGSQQPAAANTGAVKPSKTACLLTNTTKNPALLREHLVSSVHHSRFKKACWAHLSSPSRTCLAAGLTPAVAAAAPQGAPSAGLTIHRFATGSATDTAAALAAAGLLPRPAAPAPHHTPAGPQQQLTGRQTARRSAGVGLTGRQTDRQKEAAAGSAAGATGIGTAAM